MLRINSCSGHELIKVGENYKGDYGEVRKGGDKGGPVVINRSYRLEQSRPGRQCLTGQQASVVLMVRANDCCWFEQNADQ